MPDSYILRRLDERIAAYKKENEGNEMSFAQAVEEILSQVEIYDQIWYTRESPENGHHSSKTTELIKEMIHRLENTPDGGAECFPFEMIDALTREFL